jgi:dienelactone hydrolase
VNAGEQTLEIPAAGVLLEADVAVPEAASGAVVFAHGSGSSRHSPRNRYVAGELQRAGLGTVLVDLLTADEEKVDIRTREHRFDIDLLAGRLAELVGWLEGHQSARGLGIGLFGASTGAAAALRAAAARPDRVRTVVSRGGRPDLAGEALAHVRAPTLLIVGADDTPVIPLNDAARRQMHAPVEMRLVPGASHLFEEPGTLAAASALARDWFVRQLAPEATSGSSHSARDQTG